MPIESNLAEAFNDCLNRLKAGEELSQCLDRYPHLANELRPLLNMTGLAITATEATSPTQMRSRARFLAAGAKLRPGLASPAWAGWRTLSPLLGLGATLALVWLVLSLAINPILNQSTVTPPSTLPVGATQLVSTTPVQTITALPSGTASQVAEPSLTPTPTARAATSTATATRVRPSVTVPPASSTPLPTSTETATNPPPPSATNGSPSTSTGQTVVTQPPTNATETQGPDSPNGTPEPGDDHGGHTGGGDD